ncbi:hypothetical protein FOA43_002584 [Brettanomyces nanus]|uniref:Uncharacterized protein n=1 Tax=Eeniella nana TaxID=13502 RepID=A0A875S7V8_EENNA|nr:uncharacterized protein FOA43_002584 [Brettanomyces nanus]QPG75234.1 hypothetical protein FOA43_002584 [Brettanomyces nanus]
MIYLIDTVGGCAFTLYFVYFWFSHENSSENAGTATTVDANEVVQMVKHLVKRVSEDLSSQSASESYELFMTIAVTIGTTVIRFYFALVMLSFFNQIVLKSKYNSQFRLTTSTNGGRFRIFLNRVEVACFGILNKICK